MSTNKFFLISCFVVMAKAEKQNPKHDAIIKIFGDNVRKYRKLKNMNQQQLADACDVDVITVSRIERNISNTTISTLAIIAHALEIEPSELLNVN